MIAFSYKKFFQSTPGELQTTIHPESVVENTLRATSHVYVKPESLFIITYSIYSKLLRLLKTR